VPPKKKSNRSKALLEEGTLNSVPERVRDPKFQASEFFDPEDVVQVKYEMLRRVLVEKASVTVASEEYGVTRPTFYQTESSFEKAGIVGLVPKKRGPRGRHKLGVKVMEFLEKQVTPGDPIRARALAKLVQEKLSLKIHPRTIERALGVKKTSR
jgi:hypothetical protein